MLTAEELQLVEKRLIEERERTLESLKEFERDRETSLLEDTGELTAYRLHPADLGTESMEREKMFLLASVEGRRLADLDEALRKLYAEPERVGVCERCGQKIPVERLEVIPEARFCAECQSITEEQA
jgi:RNA polymerase-binding transcription factor DksA